MPTTDKPWFLEYFEVRDGTIRLALHPSLDWLATATDLVEGRETIDRLASRNSMAGGGSIQACLALHAWCLANPTADPLTLFAPPEPAPSEAAGQPEFAKEVAEVLAKRRGNDEEFETEVVARASLAQVFAEAYNDFTYEDLVWLAATCQQIAEDLGLTPDA